MIPAVGVVGDGSEIPLGRTCARVRWVCRGARARAASCHAFLRERDGQGTTEYAILVGVLVLMAIVAVVAFRDRLQELWTAITDGINSL